ncbi:VOC family protein [Mycolicibacterium sp.]|uniref:VOC family protein n=1 Tax=Mycolicibacterium sp. TaxID=2320850 RepID=UPI00355EFE42
MIHHLAITPRNFAVSHEFYTQAMQFELVKVVKRQAMGGPSVGWSKHVFYRTGSGGLFVLWDLHLQEVDTTAEGWDGGISTGLGLPWWVNHIAFAVRDADELEDRKQHLLAHGCKVSEVDHEFITSIYTKDPDGNMVEFTMDKRPFDDSDIAEAHALLADDTPAELPDYEGTLYLPDGRVIAAPSSQ